MIIHMSKSLLVLFLLLVACKTSQELAMESTETTFLVIDSGVLYGAGEEGFESGAYLINSIEEMEKILLKMNSVNSYTINLEYQSTYFHDHTIIFLFDEVRGSAGHTFELKKIDKNEKGLILKVKRSQPEGMAASVMTQPFQVIEIPKQNGSLELEVISP